MKAAIPYLIIAGVVLVLIIVGLVFATIFGWLLNVLYIFLILLALLLVVATGLQVFSIYLLVRTITTIRDEMKPLLESVQETISIVKDTAQTAGHTVSTLGTATKLTSELAVVPSVRAAAAVVAGQQMMRTFLGKGMTRSRSEQRRQQQKEALSGAGGE